MLIYKRPTVILTLILISAVAGSLGAKSLMSQQQSSASKSTELHGSIRERVQQAKAKGQQEIIKPTPIPLLAVVDDLNDALSNFTAVVAEPVGKVTSMGDANNLVTMYKFKVLERLSSVTPGCYKCLASIDPPNELIPINEDEFIAPMSGGTMVIDGVKVVNKSQDFPEFSMGQKYLLFLTLDPARSVGMFQLGAGGIFRINDDVLEAVNSRPHPLKQSLEVEHGKSLRRLKETLRHRPAAR